MKIEYLTSLLHMINHMHILNKIMNIYQYTSQPFLKLLVNCRNKINIHVFILTMVKLFKHKFYCCITKLI